MQTVEVKERPILFSGEMVRAILEGRKAQTRRVVKLDMANRFDPPRGQEDVEAGYPIFEDEYGDHHKAVDHCPYGQVGHRLWVRESIRKASLSLGEYRHHIQYCADGHTDIWSDWMWQRDVLPSIHMPKGMCRLFLEITDVRVERIQEISIEDLIAEGMHSNMREYDACVDLSEKFKALWNRINASRGFGWDVNPWVWCVSFKRVD